MAHEELTPGGSADRAVDRTQGGHLAAARTELGEHAGALAARLRQDGVPPERMLVVVKDAARAATPPDADVAAARELMAHAVRRGIDAYYAA